MNAEKISAARADMLKKYGKQEAKTADKSEMNKDMFLNLLVKQMQYQDPLEPTKNEDFLAQMAQFSALEQMKNLNTGFMMQQGNNLIGKIVTGKIVDKDSGKTTEVGGLVKSIRLQDSEVYLIVQDEKQKMHEIKLSKVEEVGDAVDAYIMKNSLEKISQTLESINGRIDELSKKVEEVENTGGTENLEDEGLRLAEGEEVENIEDTDENKDEIKEV